MTTIDVSWINFILMNINAGLFTIFSIVSVMPVTLEERYGKRAWKICYYLRILMSVFIIGMIVNMILWIWIPLEELSWKVSTDHLVSAIIGFIIVIPCTIILYVSLKHGGEEHMKPKQETKLHGGIYKIIRHPGVIGEMPWYVSIGFFLNSLFLVVWSTIFILIYIPIYIYFEEKDLVKRFGEEYLTYRDQTGALVPKFWRKAK